MHIFEFKGFTGFLMVLLIFGVVLFLTMLLPAMLCTAVWNAVVFESFAGPKVTLLQGALLWIMLVFTTLLILKPDISGKLKQIESLEDDDFFDEDFFSSHSKDSQSSVEKHSEHWKKWRQALEKKEEASRKQSKKIEKPKSKPKTKLKLK